MQVPFVDLKKQYNAIKGEIDDSILDVIENTAFIGGRYVNKFEEMYAEYCNAKHCIGVGNGTDSIFVALKALNIGVGDEVIVPANTFVATSEAVSMAGARVVFIDCDPTTYNLNIELLPKLITKKTKCVIPVHLYGQPVEMERVRDIANQYQLHIIQDCAQAHGAKINNNYCINYGDILCYSFYPGKNLGAYGDAGAIVTNDDEIAIKARMLSNHGRISKYDHEVEGINSRLDGIQAAILLVKLKYINDWVEKRRKNASLYAEKLKNLNHVKIPYSTNLLYHVYHLYVIRSDSRNELQKYLQNNGISTGIHYPLALPNLKAYKYLNHSYDDFPVASKIQEEILSLPMFPELTENQICYVTDKIKEFYSK